MRILLLTPRLPWPPRDGGRVAMSRLATSLAGQGATIEILSLNPQKHHASAELAPIPARAIDIDTSEILRPFFRAISSDLPYIVARFMSREFHDAFRAALQTFQPDLVQIESPFLLPYAETVRAESSALVVLRSLNVEFRIWEALGASSRNPLRRLAFLRTARSLRKYELRSLNVPDAIVPISSADAEDFRDLGFTRPMHVAPCGVMLPSLLQSGEAPGGEPGSVGFIGSLDFKPNQEAVIWILEEMWPRVQKRSPQARLSIAGSGAPAWLEKHALRRGIAIQSDIADAETFVQGMSVMIAPLFSGGGMRIKVLDAMALSKPVVATTLGAGGVIAENGRDIVIADDAASFAEAVAGLLSEGEKARRIGENARATVVAHYDSDAIARNLLRFYESLLSRPS